MKTFGVARTGVCAQQILMCTYVHEHHGGGGFPPFGKYKLGLQRRANGRIRRHDGTGLGVPCPWELAYTRRCWLICVCVCASVVAVQAADFLFLVLTVAVDQPCFS